MDFETQVAVLLTVHNRKETTVSALRRLLEISHLVSGVRYDIYLTDDGCSDGTVEAVRALCPELIVIPGDGNLFWSQGMNRAWKKAAEKRYDYYLWFNDDAFLFENALPDLMALSKEYQDKAIIVGAFQDRGGQVSYGGRTRERELIVPGSGQGEVFFMNGNLVLIPEYVFNILGFMDEKFTHSFGDWDYGQAARRQGIPLVLTPRFVGETDRHDSDVSPYFSTENGLRKRLKLLYSPKYSVWAGAHFYAKNMGVLEGLKYFLAHNYRCFFPKEN